MLDIDNDEYLEMFGVQVSATLQLVRDHTYETGRALKRIPNLKTLEVYFKNPRTWRYVDPWRKPPPKFGGAKSCSRTLTDWILAFGKKHIQQIPNVKLKGAIKHSVRRKWEELFEAEGLGYHWDETRYLNTILHT